MESNLVDLKTCQHSWVFAPAKFIYQQQDTQHKRDCRAYVFSPRWLCRLGENQAGKHHQTKCPASWRPAKRFTDAGARGNSRQIFGEIRRRYGVWWGHLRILACAVWNTKRIAEELSRFLL